MSAAARPPSRATGTAVQPVTTQIHESITVTTAQTPSEDEEIAPGQPYPGHSHALKIIFDGLESISQKSAQKTSTLLNVRTRQIMTVLRHMKEEAAKGKPAIKEDPMIERLHNIETAIIEMKTQMKSAVKTYAQAATTPPTELAKAKISPERKKILEEGRKERRKYEITLTANNAPEDIKSTIESTDNKGITAQCQKAINKANIKNKPTLKGVNKLAKNILRLYFETAEETERVREADIEWEEAYPGLTVHKPKYGVVVHGVPTEAIDLDKTHDETLRQWEMENTNKQLKIVNAIPLRRREKHKTAAHQSVVIFTESPTVADECIKIGFNLNCQRLKTEKYSPNLHINQCYKCHKYGHRSTNCKRKEVCGKCGQDNHRTIECNAEKPCCVNCGEDHEAWNVKCARRTEEGNKLHKLRMDALPLFT